MSTFLWKTKNKNCLEKKTECSRTVEMNVQKENDREAEEEFQAGRNKYRCKARRLRSRKEEAKRFNRKGFFNEVDIKRFIQCENKEKGDISNPEV